MPEICCLCGSHIFHSKEFISRKKKWRKFQISNLFSRSSVATELHTIDVCIVEYGSEITDKWLVAITLASGQTSVALDRRYMSYNLAQIAGVATNVS